MSVAALEHLEACQQGLIAALDGHDVEALEASIVRLSEAVSVAKAAGAWRDRPEVVQHARRITALSEAARVRVNFLTDLTQRRLEQLATARGQAPAAVYSRNGRQIA
jgi:hypothetical protein